MKTNKKAKQQIFLTINKSNNKLQQKSNTKQQKSKTYVNVQSSKQSHIIPSNQHRKLLQYRDYLLSLRKMDLGTLINKNTNKKHQSKRNQQKFRQNNHIQVYRKQQQTQYSNQNSKNKDNSISNQNIDINKKQRLIIKNPQTHKSQKIKQINLIKSSTKKQTNQFNKDNIQKDQIKNEDKQKKNQNKKPFKLFIRKDIEQEDLYCDEDMQQLMNNKSMCTPRLLHIKNYTMNERDYSTHRSSRCRDFSMPSIQQRNLSQQSEDSIQKKQKQQLRSFSDINKHRKYNSCNHNTSHHSNSLNQTDSFNHTHTISFNQNHQSQNKQKSKRNSIISIPLSSRTNTYRNQSDQTFYKQNLLSTRDNNSIKTNSSNKQIKIKQRNNFNVNINPFNLKSQFNYQKQHHKLSLNVSQIVKRINTRQSKSSMSDRSYKQNTSTSFNKTQQKNQLLTKDHKKSNNIEIQRNNYINYQKQQLIKQKISKIVFDHSKLLINNKNNLQFDQLKKKSFKAQVKQFRQKHYLMMKIAE